MEEKYELTDEELETVTGGGTEPMQEVYHFANKQFLEILARGGTVEDLDNVMKSVNEMIENYNTKEGKIMNVERPMIEAQIRGLYDSFVQQLKK